ncbi:hypothetical protein B0H16DRAFT_1749091 [Mycena metata]|uniref:Uncharacterized protein n=1 Tax=Mycena metata TaxID=1033252 RepID=A0AAD7DXH3_9AGAR|nr:hypothetical protein B0H16DRAFT_1749091 [Mycena metata]
MCSPIGPRLALSSTPSVPTALGGADTRLPRPSLVPPPQRAGAAASAFTRNGAQGPEQRPMCSPIGPRLALSSTPSVPTALGGADTRLPRPSLVPPPQRAGAAASAFTRNGAQGPEQRPMRSPIPRLALSSTPSVPTALGGPDTQPPRLTHPPNALVPPPARSHVIGRKRRERRPTPSPIDLSSTPSLPTARGGADTQVPRLTHPSALDVNAANDARRPPPSTSRQPPRYRPRWPTPTPKFLLVAAPQRARRRRVHT